MKIRYLILTLLSVALFSPVLAQDTTTNFVDSCVAEDAFDSEVDYFPEKVEITDAENFTIEYFNNYKVLTVVGSSGAEYHYVLVQCGTPSPDLDDFPVGTQSIEVPAGNFISLSTTQLPHLSELGLLDQLAGIDSFIYTSTPEVREMIDAGQLIEVAPNFELNMESVFEADPSILMTDDFSIERLALLADAGVFAAVNSDYLEATPLGRAEWLKYTALFYNKEAAAEEIYDSIVTAYNEASELAATIPEDARPTVLWNIFASFDGAWGISGEDTFAGRLITDAGGNIALAELAPEGIAYVGFEVVYEGALDADIWVANAFGINTLDNLIAMEERYMDFAPVQEDNVWNNDLDVNENFGNNYYELGVTNPHLVLRDLIAIFHPELMPDHEFTFYRKLEPAE